jgi:hypothetical protein
MVRSLYTKTFCLSVMVFAFAVSGRAQFIGTPPPPPPKAAPINFTKTLDSDGVPKDFPEQDKARIIREKDEKERFKIYVSYLGAYRDQALRSISQNNSGDAIKALTIYAGIARHAVTFFTTEVPSKKRESVLKKLDLDLRSDLLYFEPMVRDFSFYHNDNAAALVLIIKQARVDALNASFGGEILSRPGEKP